jgi:hypothetical protein
MGPAANGPLHRCPRIRAHASEGEAGKGGRSGWGTTARRCDHASDGGRLSSSPPTLHSLQDLPASASSHLLLLHQPPLQFHTKHTGKSIATKNPRFPLCAPLPPRRRREEPTTIRLSPALPSPPSPGDPIGRGLAGKKDRARIDTQANKGILQGRDRCVRYDPSPSPPPRPPPLPRSSVFRITRSGSGRSVCFSAGLLVCLFNFHRWESRLAAVRQEILRPIVLPRVGQPWPAAGSVRPAPSFTGACFNLCLSVPAPLVSSWRPPCTSSSRFSNALLINFPKKRKSTLLLVVVVDYDFCGMVLGRSVFVGDVCISSRCMCIHIQSRLWELVTKRSIFFCFHNDPG